MWSWPRGKPLPSPLGEVVVDAEVSGQTFKQVTNTPGQGYQGRILQYMETRPRGDKEADFDFS